MSLQKIVALLVVLAVLIEWHAAEDIRHAPRTLTWRERGLILAADVERVGALILAGCVWYQ